MAIIARWRMPPDSLVRESLSAALGIGDADMLQQLHSLRMRRRGRRRADAAHRFDDLRPNPMHRI